MDGKEFIKQLRASGNPVDVIMVTAASDINNIRSLLSYGLVDYLVKPFEYSRFAVALNKFIQKQNVIEHNEGLSQQQLDEFLSTTSFSKNAEKDILPSKGLQSKTLDSIRSYLSKHTGEGLTSEHIADEVGLSRVTIRRYMNYLIELKEVSSDVDYNTGGRPSIIYHYKQ
jgi:CitB family two-component system response regulator MalR/two-component system response regulator DctR